VRVVATNNQNISEATITKLVFDAEAWDTDGFYPGSGGDITIPTGLGGKYLITGVNEVTFPTVTTYKTAISIYIGSGEIATRRLGGVVASSGAGNGFGFTGHITTVEELADGDVISMRVFYDALSGTSTIITNSDVGGETNLSLVKVG
jgi:hypothetical protein